MSGHSLYVRHAAAVSRAIGIVCAFFRLRDADADDFGQIAHLYLIEHEERVFGRFAEQASLESYLVVVLRHLAGDFCRRRASAHSRTTSLVQGREHFQTRAASNGPDRRHLDEEARGAARRAHTALVSALQTLSPETQTIVHQLFVAERDVTGIAKALHITPKAVYRRWDRARATLRRGMIKAGISAADVDDILDAVARGVLALDGSMETSDEFKPS